MSRTAGPCRPSAFPHLASPSRSSFRLKPDEYIEAAKLKVREEEERRAEEQREYEEWYEGRLAELAAEGDEMAAEELEEKRRQREVAEVERSREEKQATEPGDEMTQQNDEL